MLVYQRVIAMTYWVHHDELSLQTMMLCSDRGGSAKTDQSRPEMIVVERLSFKGLVFTGILKPALAP